MHKKAQKRHYKKKKRSIKTLRLLGEIKLYPATSAESKNAPKGLPTYYPKNFKNDEATLFRSSSSLFYFTSNFQRPCRLQYS